MDEQADAQRTQPTRTRLKIWQQNVNGSKKSHLDLLNAILPQHHHVLAIQEPHTNKFGISRGNRGWQAFYPPTHLNDPNSTRSMLLVSTAIPSDRVRQIPIDSKDITAIQLLTEEGPVTIYNIYNDCNHSEALDTLDAHLQACQENPTAEDDDNRMIWLGDFNRHHPLWDELRNEHLFTHANLNAAEQLIELAAQYDMEMALPPGIPTLKAFSTGNQTRTDNVFCSNTLMPAVTLCDTKPNYRPVKTDHYPIRTHLELHLLHPATTHVRHNYRKAEWDEFRKTLRTALAQHPPPATETIPSITEFDSLLEAVMKAIQTATQAAVPILKPSPFTSRWWNADLTERRRVLRAKGRQSTDKTNQPNHPSHEEYRRLRNEYGDALQKAKEDHWKDWLENVSEQSLWDANRLVTRPSTDGCRDRIPTLTDIQDGTELTCNTNTLKSKVLFSTFFPNENARPEVNRNANYPDEKFSFQQITDEQIQRAIDKLRPYKAPGPDGIPNAVYKRCSDLLIPYLGPLFRSTFTLDYYPASWKNYTTIVLKKPARPDYSKPKAYRGIALLSTMSKILSACVAEDLSYWVEKLQLLPTGHFGARPGRNTTDALHLLLDFIKRAWRRGHVVTVLFLDIKGAFPSVVVDTLIHDMRTRGIPRKYTNWIKTKLTRRQTTIAFDDYESEAINITNGVDQGCPLSPLLYQFYNAALIEVAQEAKGELATGFLDDVAYAIEGEDFDDTNEHGSQMMTRSGGANDWAESHHSEIETDKLKALGMSRRREPNPNRNTKAKTIPITRPPITINGRQIPLETHAKYLGIIVDQELRFKEHASYALAKGTTWLHQVRRLARPAFGMPHKYIRKLYLAVCIPKMLYGCDIFCAYKIANPDTKTGMIPKMARVQRMAAMQITGALKSSPNDSLNIHADLLPLKHTIRQICHRSALRIAALPNTHPLYKPIRKAARRYIKSHRSPLHELTGAYHIQPDEIETIHPARYDPKHRFRYLTSPEGERMEESVYRTHGAMALKPIRIYSDGSGIEGNVGSAAVILGKSARTGIRRYQLGSIRHHTVYEAEIVGLLLALELIRDHRINRRTVILLDNQAVIKALTLRTHNPSHYLIDLFHAEFQRLTELPQHEHLEVEVAWVRGHTGNKGNERADHEAKKAAQGKVTATNRLPTSLRTPLPHSVSALKMAQLQKIKTRNAADFALSPRYRKLTEIDPSVPSAAYRKMVDQLSRKNVSILTQLRMGHVPLNAYIHRINRAESPLCPFCTEAHESVISTLR